MPEFQDQAWSTRNAAERASEKRAAYSEAQLRAVAHMTEKYRGEVAGRAGQ